MLNCNRIVFFVVLGIEYTHDDLKANYVSNQVNFKILKKHRKMVL